MYEMSTKENINCRSDQANKTICELKERLFEHIHSNEKNGMRTVYRIYSTKQRDFTVALQ
jgi:hypothetical protein